MASFQVCGSAQAYECKNKSVVKEMCNNAQNTMTKHCNEQGAVTAGHIRNNTECVKFLSKHDWSGRSKVPYPQTIASCHTGAFVHTSSCHGSKDEGAVVYKNECNAFLMAWSVQDHCGCNKANKVYVETGPVENYIEVNWCDIKAKLDASCDTSYYVDDCTDSEIFGKITPGNKASLVVSFDRC